MRHHPLVRAPGGAVGQDDAIAHAVDRQIGIDAEQMADRVGQVVRHGADPEPAAPVAGTAVEAFRRDIGATPEAAAAHCAARLSACKVPRLWRLVADSELPLTVTGKLQKNRLAALFGAG